jgi:phage-related tail fiber protein
MTVSISGLTGITFPDLSVKQSASIAIGTLIYFCANTAPAGYVKANGAVISRTTYASLFAVIGTTFGAGDGSTTFGIPDARGYFVRGWDDARGIDSGRVFGTNQTDAMQGHFHNFGQRNGVNGAGGGSYAWGVSEGGPNYPTGSPITDGTNGTPRTAAETRPVNLALLACIKYI